MPFVSCVKGLLYVGTAADVRYGLEIKCASKESAVIFQVRGNAPNYCQSDFAPNYCHFCFTNNFGISQPIPARVVSID